MTKEEFYELQVGARITNKTTLPLGENGSMIEIGYDYDVIMVDTINPIRSITVRETKMGGVYDISANEVESCLNLRKK